MASATTPIGIGYVGAYCRKRFGPDDVDIRIFRTLTNLRSQLLQAPPDIVGFGSYTWNFSLTIKAAELVKASFPECLIVMGGANVSLDSESNQRFRSEHRAIDLLVHGDGEYPFADIVGLMLQHNDDHDRIERIKNTPLDGVRSLTGNGIVMGAPVHLVADLDDIPSPYLTGLLDEYLADSRLMPILQSVRGCPFTCQY